MGGGGGAGVLSCCFPVGRLILGRFSGRAWRGGLVCLPFGDMSDSLWASLGVALGGGASQSTDFVLFSRLLLWMLVAFRRRLIYSLINGFLIVWVIAVVRGSGLSSGCYRALVDLLAGLVSLRYCGGLNDMEARHRAGRVWGWSGFGGMTAWAGVWGWPWWCCPGWSVGGVCYGFGGYASGFLCCVYFRD